MYIYHLNPYNTAKYTPTILFQESFNHPFSNLSFTVGDNKLKNLLSHFQIEKLK